MLQQSFLETTLIFASEHREKHNSLVKLIKEVYDQKQYLLALESAISMIPDMALDTPDVAEQLGEFAAKINERIDHKLMREMASKLKSIILNMQINLLTVYLELLRQLQDYGIKKC